MTSCEESSHRKAAGGRVLSAIAGQQYRAKEDAKKEAVTLITHVVINNVKKKLEGVLTT